MNPDQTQIEWLDLKGLQRHACVSERTLREWIHRPDNPLPSYRVGGKIFVRRSEFDRWVEAHRLNPIDVTAIVDEMMSEVTNQCR
jgi:excisionase family DNA binding protein